MEFVSWRVTAFFMAAVVLFHLFPRGRRPAVLVPVLNAAFIILFAGDARGALPLAGFLLLGFACVRLAGRRPSGLVLAASAAVVVGVFAYLKKYTALAFLPGIERPYLTMGLSYVLFRILHLLVDLAEGSQSGEVSLADFFGYSCFFPGFVSGPIQRYPDYRDCLRDQAAPGRGPAWDALSRIADGYLKIAVVSVAFSALHGEFAARLLTDRYSFQRPLQAGLFCVACSTYTIYLYANFAGYMDVIIGFAALMGLRLPENFDRPFAARSFLEFWSRWHITLSDWFKFYVFNPILKALTERWGGPKRLPYLAALAFFVTFVLMGVWHGTSGNYLFYGVWLGVGVSANKLWEVWLRKRLGRAGYAALGESRLYGAAGAGLTFSYFSIALTCVWMDPARVLWYFGHLGAFGLAAVWVGVGAVAVVILAALEESGRATGLLLRRWCGPESPPPLRLGLLSLKYYLLLQFLASPPAVIPDFVYRGF